MNQKYSHISTLLCKHEYFKHGIFNPIGFTIADETVKLMKNLGIVLKQFKGGFHLLCSNPELLASEKNENSLKIYLNCSDPYYINYTNLSDYAPIKDLLYFNNLSTKITQNSDRLTLNSDTYVGENERLQLCQGNLKIPKFDSAKSYVFKDAAGEEIPIDSIRQSMNDPAIFNIVNLSEGLIQIVSGNNVEYEVYYNPNIIWKKPLGVIELFTGILFNDFQRIGMVEYELNFNNRQTFWKYYLTGTAYRKFNDLSIVNKKEATEINRFQKLQVQQDTMAIVFESEKELPLLEYSEDTFQLVDNYDSNLRSGKVIIKSLPCASPEQLFQENLPNNKHIYSHIYIY